MKRSQVVTLAGGVGAARFLDGLARVIEPERVYIIGNTADELPKSTDFTSHPTSTPSPIRSPAWRTLCTAGVFGATASGVSRRWGGWALIPGFGRATWTWPRICTGPNGSVRARRFPK